MIRVPVLTPRLSSLWLALVTPLLASVGKQLIDSIRHSTVVRDPAAESALPVRPRGYVEAVAMALRSEDAELAERRWSGAAFSGRIGNYLVNSQSLPVPVNRQCAFAPVLRLGGANGWPYGDWLWSLRGLLDRLVGGVGMRRTSRASGPLAPGDIVDCWRVEAIDPATLLRLRAEMKLPGRAWLQFEVTDHEGGSLVTQTALFDARGVLGRMYWWVLYPIHEVIFEGMLHSLATQAMQERGS